MKKSLQIFLLLIINYSLLISNCSSQWVQQPIPTGQLVQDMHFVDTMHGWLACSNGAVSDSGVILYTSTGGTSWVTQYDSGSTPLFGIKMANINTGYCVGGYRKILKTTNSGQNWINTNITVGSYFKDLAVINTDTLYVCVEDSPFQGILKSTNGGNSYSIQFTSNVNVLNFINSETGWAVSSNFNLRRTTNGGVNWITVHSFPSDITDIFFIDANTGWLNGGDSSGMARTTNGGLNWIFQTLPSGSFGFGGIFMLNANTGWSGGSGNQIHKTTNGGANWILYTGLPIFTTQKIWFPDSSIGWCGRGGLAKSTNGGISPVINNNSQVPENNILSQNYPNPFNPYTKIRFDIRTKNFVTLKIFDLLGRETYTLINRELNAGVYETGFDGSSLPSGTYFYRLTVNGVTIDTKKMVLVK